MTLSPATCKALAPGGVLNDDVVTGLQLRAFGQRKTWSLRYRTKAGRERRARLGNFPGLSIEHARRAARTILEQVAAGRDPGRETAEQRIKQPTVSDLCDKYEKMYLPTIGEYTASLNKRVVDKYVRPGLGRMLVDDVEQSDIEQFLSDVYHRRYAKASLGPNKVAAPVMANRTRDLLTNMFKLAMTQSYGYMRSPARGNPVTGTTRHGERRRKRIAEPHEMEAIGRVLNSLREKHPREIAALLTIWYTGARKNEIAKAAVTALREVRGAHRLVLDRHKTVRKTGEEKIIDLPRQVVEMIYSLPRDGSGYLFGDVSVKGVWNRIRKGAGCPDLTIHDIRRTFISIGLDGGFSLEQMGKLVGHERVETTNGYAYLLQGRRREMVQSVADRVEGWMQPALPAPQERADGGQENGLG